MRPSELLSEIIDNYKTRTPMLVTGPPGAGKSDLFKQAAKLLDITLRDERLPQLDPVDLRGIPVPTEDGRTKFNPPTLLPTEKDDGEFGILFLDEITSCPLSMQGASYQLILDRKCGDYQLPDGWAVMAAGNNAKDRAITVRTSTALNNRFAHYELEVDTPDWIDWALLNGIHTNIIQFIRHRPALLHNMENALANDERAFPTPRSWAALSKQMPFLTSKNEVNKITAHVGVGARTEFLAFLRIVDSLDSFDKIIQDPNTARISEDPAVLSAICGMLIDNVSEATFAKTMQYTDRIFAEYQAMFVQDAIKKNESFAATPEFITWAQNNAQKIF